MLRIVPLLLFLSHSLSLLQALHCQTSPNFSHLKYGTADKHVELDFAGEGGLLYYISSALLFWESDAESCLAVDLIPSKSENWDRKGSLSLLWPLFQSLCLGQFVETLSSTVQGRPLMIETGMSIFEHSVAFAESEAMISSWLGLSLIGSPANRATSSSAEDGTVTKFFTKSEILQKMNTPPEVLLMGLISSLNNLCSHVLGVFDMQARYRLLNTGVWGLCFMGAFVWAFFSSITMQSGLDSIVLRFPTVCIVGFIPHLLILCGILLCFCIYLLGLILSFALPPTDGPQPQSLMDRFRLARENMSANTQLSNFRLEMREDFYTALLRIGFSALTVASEAVYLNEGERVKVSPLTWLEEDKLEEIEAASQLNVPLRHLGVQWAGSDGLAKDGSARVWKSGYAQEIKPSTMKNSSGRRIPRSGSDGVGHVQRYGRYLGVLAFFNSIFGLAMGWMKLFTNRLFDRLGIAWRPQWLILQKQREETQHQLRGSEQRSEQELQPFWAISVASIFSPSALSEVDDFDTEKEIKRRIRHETTSWAVREDEEDFDTRCYNWFKQGEWGGKDESGTYQESVRDDDTTSVVSMSTAASEDEWEETDIDSGASTPRQSSLYSNIRSASQTPEPSFGFSTAQLDPHPLDPQHFASLLDPKTPEARAAARNLAHHLTSPKPLTRSQYNNAQNLAARKLLTSTRYRAIDSTVPYSGPLSREEEEQLLEQLILSSRAKPSDKAARSWREGAAGMGQSGPQCVVCQSAPRTVLAFPCRCLSLCEECRVSLAMNNFATCVCCRQDVSSFSRLFVP